MPVIEKIKKRNGQIVDFDFNKIVAAVEKAFLARLGDSKTGEARSIAEQVVRKLEEQKGTIAPSVEQVQDLVEQALMERGFYYVARSYIIYRYEHAKGREEKREETRQKIEESSLRVTKSSGKQEPFSSDKLRKTLSFATVGHENAIDVEAIIVQCTNEVYEGITTKEIAQLLIMVTRSFIERDPAYSVVAARLLLFVIYRETIGDSIDYTNLDELYRKAFVNNIERGVELKRLDEKLLSFDLEKLAGELVLSRDYDFKYLGLQTIYDRYFVKDNAKKVLETPQMFWMRIAMGAVLNEEEKEERAVEFYDSMSNMLYTPSTPTLFHAGTPRPQLSSCYLNTVPDSLEGIFKTYADNAQLSKYSGGIGTDWTPVRATGAGIKGTGVESQGVIPFLKIANDVTAAINRSGRRRGATCVYLETWHYDIESFLELKKNTGDERRRTHDLNTANWIPDLFIKRVKEEGSWTLFSPDETPDLHDLYGRAFEERYVEYEERADRGEMNIWKRIPAKDLWRKMMTMLFETGHPWITFKDSCNIRSPQDHVGVVHSSNLCTEITLNTAPDRTAVCNLGSLNLAKFVKDNAFDHELVERVVPIAIRMLDNVIDSNFYPTEDARRSNMSDRPVGLGVRGFQDALYQLNIRFDSEAAVQFSDESMESIAYHAILASSNLARERGAYETYKGSKWDRGIFPQDTIELLERERNLSIDVPRNERLNWKTVRESVTAYGMRNSNVMALAPTATTANIVGCFPTIEPAFSNLYVKSNQAGDFIVVNDYLIEDLKKYGIWNKSMLMELKYYNGSVQDIPSIPQELKEKHKEVFDIEPTWLIKAAAYRGRWIDQSQSLNIFFRGTSGKALTEIYFYAWEMGLKTTYYLRTSAASQVEKSTIDTEAFGATHKRNGSVKRVSVGVSAHSPIVPSPRVATPREAVSIVQKQSEVHRDGEVCESCEA